MSQGRWPRGSHHREGSGCGKPDGHRHHPRNQGRLPSRTERVAQEPPRARQGLRPCFFLKDPHCGTGAEGLFPPQSHLLRFSISASAPAQESSAGVQAAGAGLAGGFLLPPAPQGARPGQGSSEGTRSAGGCPPGWGPRGTSQESWVLGGGGWRGSVVAAAGDRCLNRVHVGLCSPEHVHTGTRVPQALLSWLLPQTVPVCPRAPVPDSPDGSG